MKLSDQLKEEAKDISVLYVEDEEPTRCQITQILSLFFKEVVVASNGLEALNLYKKSPTDLIMTDLTMPQMTGLEMIKEVKKIEPKQHIVVLTAHNSSENIMETMDLQIDGFLLKPMKMDRMLTLLHKVTHTINLEKSETVCTH